MVFYDVKSDDDGCIISERLALLAYNDEDKTKSIDDVETTLNFYSLEGRVSDNIHNIQSYVQDSNDDTSNLNNPRNTHIAQALVSHAKTGKYDDNGNIQKNNQGGGIKERIVNNTDAINLCEIKINSKR